MIPPLKISKPTDLDWGAADKATKRISKIIADMGFMAPEMMDVAVMRVGEICEHLDAMSAALKLSPPTQARPDEVRGPLQVVVSADILARVAAEIVGARTKHGWYLERAEVTDDRRGHVLLEEAGEVSEALNDIELAKEEREALSRTRASLEDLADARQKIRDEEAGLEAELVQVAATSLRFLSIIEARKKKAGG